jgi:acetylornithine deacetylase/succinyl-diaminopimelate desuccinylase-like protein
MSDFSAVEAYLTANQSRFVGELTDLLRIPSVSADSAFNADTRRAGEWIASQLRSIGLATEVVETPGHPIIYGEWLGAVGAPTVMIYGHYDVQPPDPLDQWITPAFEPTIRGEHIYARGATDDKGQVLTHIKALEAWMKATGSLPVNVKVVIEGEEEVGSNNLENFLHDRRDRLRSDIAVVSDTSQFGPDKPAITYGLRGIVACEVTLIGPKQDLHSGVFGGAVGNPVNALARLIASLHDDAGRIQIPGFYDDIPPLTDKERAVLAALPFDEAKFRSDLGIADLHGEAGYTTLERRWSRPTCDVNGIKGGYQGEGPKTIIPSRATAKITCRLVPNQDPSRIVAALEQHLRSRCPAAFKLDFTNWHGCPGFMVSLDNPFLPPAKNAIERAFGVAPVLIREGGSIPVVASFREILGVDTLLLGWGQNTDNLHSPNEHFSLRDFERGTRAAALFLGHARSVAS